MENHICILCQTNQSSLECDIEGNEEGYEIHVCRECIPRLDTHFGFVCMDCGRVYLREKTEFIEALKTEGMHQAAKEWERYKDCQIIQGLAGCKLCPQEERTYNA